MSLLLSQTGTEIIAEYSSSEEVEPHQADDDETVFLLIKDCGLQDLRQEIETLRAVNPAGRIAVMLDALTADDLIEVFVAGGDGLLLEDISAEALHESLTLMGLGEKVFPSQLATLLSGGGASRETGPCQGLLTARESQIVRLLTQGRTNKEIANELDLALATVKVHIKSLLKKLGLSNRTQAAIWALDAGLVNPPKIAAGAALPPRQSAGEPEALPAIGQGREVEQGGSGPARLTVVRQAMGQGAGYMPSPLYLVRKD